MKQYGPDVNTFMCKTQLACKTIKLCSLNLNKYVKVFPQNEHISGHLPQNLRKLLSTFLAVNDLQKH